MLSNVLAELARLQRVERDLRKDLAATNKSLLGQARNLEKALADNTLLEVEVKRLRALETRAREAIALAHNPDDTAVIEGLRKAQLWLKADSPEDKACDVAQGRIMRLRDAVRMLEDTP